VLLPAGAPAGCPAGDFCSYNQTNGGDLCLKYYGNVPDMENCGNTDQSVFNNGYTGTYDVVFMYWGVNYIGAYTCLTQGNYWLTATDYKFNNRDSSDDYGYGESVGSNVESFKWGYYNCGNWYSP
jgi:Peptidase inhibitor family I36